MNTQYVMLANGKGQRFADVGYSFPKPLIEDKYGNQIWENAAKGYGILPSNLTFVTSEEISTAVFCTFKKMCVIPPTSGPLESAVQAIMGMLDSGTYDPDTDINPLRPVMFLDCDSFCNFPISRLSQTFLDSNQRCGIVCYRNDGHRAENKAKILRDVYDYALEAYERKPTLPLSEFVVGCAGAYWFRSVDDFLHLYHLHGTHITQGEPTFIRMLSSAIRQGVEPRVSVLDSEYFFCLGTPEELASWNNRT